MEDLQTIWKFKLGVPVVDVITNFKGKVVSRTEFLNGCLRYGVQPPMPIDNKDNKLPESVWMDENQLALDEAVAPTEIKRKSTGGPGDNPQNVSVPNS